MAGTATYKRNKRALEAQVEAQKYHWYPTRFTREFGPLRAEIEQSGPLEWGASIWVGDQIVADNVFRESSVRNVFAKDLAETWCIQWIHSITAGTNTEFRDCHATEAHTVLADSEIAAQTNS